MPVNPIWIWHGASIPPHSPDILGLVVDGSSSRWILWKGIPGILGGDAGGPSFSQHIKCGGGRSG